jgi:hypothetical protein
MGNQTDPLTDTVPAPPHPSRVDSPCTSETVTSPGRCLGSNADGLLRTWLLSSLVPCTAVGCPWGLPVAQFTD